MYDHFSHCQDRLADIAPIHFFLAQSVCQQHQSSNTALLFHLVMACSDALQQGHSCLFLPDIAHTTWWATTADANNPDSKPGFTFPALNEMEQLLSQTFLPSQANALVVYQHQRLYLRRYWQFEVELAEQIKAKLSQTLAIDTKLAAHTINELFTANESPDWQKIAVANAINKPLAIIAGGPGTGKTTTVTKLLAAILTLSQQPVKIALAAPTGKAAQRLNESIDNSLKQLVNQQMVSENVACRFPTKASTLHRLLGVKANSHDFKHDHSNPLELDLILIDEISMIDLPLMVRLFRALPADARVIMLGDAQQLPSVAAGSILADLAPYANNQFSKVNAEYIKQVSGERIASTELTADHITHLQKSYRFKDDSVIGMLAKQIITGDATTAWHTLQQATTEVKLITQSSSLDTWLSKLVDRFYRPVINAQTLDQAFKHFAAFRVLSPLRQGPLGIASLNEKIEAQLTPTQVGQLYPGKPIIINQNLPKLGLFNGDIGIVWPSENGLKVWFPDESGAYKPFSPARLSSYETVYAMTIHKTQGSEFDHIAMILPDKQTPLLSRELIYTGLTRARQSAEINCTEAIWQQGIAQQVQRYSGLKQRLFTS